MAIKETYEVTFSSLEIKTLGDYCVQIDSPAFQFYKKENELLNVKNPEGITNRESIFNSYTPLEFKDNENKKASQLLLKVGTILSIPTNKIQLEGLLTQGLQVVSNDEGIFKAKALADLENDLGYIQVFKDESQSDLGTTTSRTPDISVWIWCRALSQSDTLLEGELIDVSPFISKLETFVGKNGGNFNFSLAPLVCKLESHNHEGRLHTRWVLREDSITFDEKTKEYLSNANLFSEVDLKRSEFYFHNVIQANDLVFIRHETLEMEKEQREGDVSLLNITKSNIPERIYDMIGLIDTNQQTVNLANNEISIDLRGRDLIKLFIEDGVYFYNLENLSGQFRLAGATTANNELKRRIIGQNSLYYLNLFQNNSIENILKFVIQQLSSISVVPDSLFEAYAERRNTSFLEIKEKPTRERQHIKDKEDSLSTISTVLQQQSITTTTPELVYTQVYDFLKFIRKQKYRIVKGNKTFGWKKLRYGTQKLELNQLPLFIYSSSLALVGTGSYYNRLLSSQSNIVKIVDQIDSQLDNEDTTKSLSKDIVQPLSKGIWQIIKLVIDRGVVNRKLIDGSLSTDQGSLLNFVRKIAREPFVEFYTDTYGDLFHLIVRKPPFDKVSMQDLIRNKIQTEKGYVDVLTSIVTIKQHDVLKENLYFNDEVYSWYRFEPKNLGSTGGNALTTLYTPAIYFEEYAKIYGSKPLIVEHNYNPYLSTVNNDGLTDISRFEEQALLDFKYLIESHAYLPFTRKGSITINGDRRLKRGSFLRYESTGEIFHIDSVSHSSSITEGGVDSTTTLVLSRGMIEELISGVVINNKKYGYFEIINTDLKIEKKRYSDEKRVVTRTILKKKTTKVSDVNTEIQQISQSNVFADLSQQNQSELLKIEDKNNRVRFTLFLDSINRLKYETTIFDVSNNSIHILIDFAGGSLAKDTPKSFWDSTTIPEIGKKLGFKWGGKEPDYDPTRFEIPKLGYDERKRLSEETTYVEEQISEEVVVPGHVGINIEKALDNLKVDKDVFNFFLKRQQLDLDDFIQQTAQTFS